MELRQLFYFKAAAETLSFTRAAKRCHVTQSTLGQQIRQIEQELGCEMFDRTSSGLVLTENGKRLLVSARHVLSEMEEAVSDIKLPSKRRVLRLGYYGNALAPQLGHILGILRARHPDVWLEISEETPIELTNGVLDGRIDCAFTVHDPENQNTSELVCTSVHTCPYIVLVKEGVLKKPAGDVITVAEIPSPIVTLSKIQSARIRYHLEGDRPDASCSVCVPSNSHRALLLLVASGQCSALAPEDTWLDTPCVTPYRLSDLGLTFNTYLIRKKGCHNATVTALLGACRYYFRQQERAGFL